MPLTTISEDAPIVISYRMEGKDPGKAAFYDHYTLQKHTHFETRITSADCPSIKVAHLNDYIKNQTNELPYSPNEPTIGKNVPLVIDNYALGGLLVIPGMTRDSYQKNPQTHQIRIQFEQEIIKDALLRGRPILAICAGSWTLFECLGGKIEEVNDHNYGSGMPRISAKGKMTYNVHVHDVQVIENTLLSSMMGLDNQSHLNLLPANSIHWMAPQKSSLPNNIEISALSKRNPTVSIKTRQSTPMRPDKNTVEAFSSQCGAPVVGFVWHPEAFDWSSLKFAEQANSKALLFMAKAGTAYQNKQKMLAQLKETQSEMFELENHLSSLNIG